MTDQEKIASLEAEMKKINTLYIDELVKRSEAEARCRELYTTIKVLTNLEAFK